MTLIEPTLGPRIDGIQIPKEVYWVLSAPGPLAGMTYPRPDFPWKRLYAAGFTHVVSLHPGSYKPDPLKVAFSEDLEDLVGGGPPRREIEEIGKVGRAVAATVSALKAGQGTVVHCMGGRGRSGTVLGCTLRELGMASTDVIAFLDRVHKARGKSGWPESPWQSSLVTHWPERGSRRGETGVISS